MQSSPSQLSSPPSVSAMPNWYSVSVVSVTWTMTPGPVFMPTRTSPQVMVAGRPGGGSVSVSWPVSMLHWLQASPWQEPVPATTPPLSTFTGVQAARA